MAGEKTGLILLTLMLLPLVFVSGPQALGALAGAAMMLGMIRIVGPKMDRDQRPGAVSQYGALYRPRRSRGACPLLPSVRGHTAPFPQRLNRSGVLTT